SGTISNSPIANILLPRSKSDVDTSSHRFNDVQESLISRGGGTATGVLSNIASTAVFGALESITQGIMADNNEQIYTTARSMYGGAENRTKVFTWDLTPRSTEDLMAIINIYQYFNYFSYGETGKSQYAAEIKGYLDD
ncbi:baseplate tail-tube junction protein, partial [Enterococcus faecalis]|uniref:baseplate tail-tube junction protein n=1 Tax=Enterococcus faecalis TaxID=1351 RepID=UPI00398540F0